MSSSCVLEVAVKTFLDVAFRRDQGCWGRSNNKTHPIFSRISIMVNMHCQCADNSYNGVFEVLISYAENPNKTYTLPVRHPYRAGTYAAGRSLRTACKDHPSTACRESPQQTRDNRTDAVRHS